MRNLTMRPRRYDDAVAVSNDSNDELEATPETITKEIDQFNENAGSVAEDGQVEVEVS
jgi:hypothetical protein